jgi:hypothetical protein
MFSPTAFGHHTGEPWYAIIACSVGLFVFLGLSAVRFVHDGLPEGKEAHMKQAKTGTRFVQIVKALTLTAWTIGTGVMTKASLSG